MRAQREQRGSGCSGSGGHVEQGRSSARQAPIDEAEALPATPRWRARRRGAGCGRAGAAGSSAARMVCPAASVSGRPSAAHRRPACDERAGGPAAICWYLRLTGDSSQATSWLSSSSVKRSLERGADNRRRELDRTFAHQRNGIVDIVACTSACDRACRRLRASAGTCCWQRRRASCSISAAGRSIRLRATPRCRAAAAAARARPAFWPSAAPAPAPAA